MAAKEEPTQEGKGLTKDPKKMKLLMIIGGAVLAVIIVIVAVVLFAGGGSTAKQAEAKVEKAAEGGGGHGGGKEGEKGPVANVYPLDPFIVNIYDGQEIRYLKLKVEFETEGADAKGLLDSRQAPLRDAILVLLTTKTLHDIQDLQGKNQLRGEILAAANKILPPGKVGKVYFTDFVVQ